MNESRSKIWLNAVWCFNRGDVSEAWYKGYDDKAWREVTLPHDWAVEADFSKDYSSGSGYLPGGTGWYRKHVVLPDHLEGKRAYLTFEGVYNHSQVWVNSYYLGKRPYGYSTFTYEITDLLAYGGAENIIAVKVNHAETADSRWYTGSGIYRDVYLTLTHDIHVAEYGVFASTAEIGREGAELQVETRILNETGEPAEISVRHTLIDDDGINAGTSVELLPAAGGTELSQQVIQVKEPKLWSPEAPNMYTLLTEIIWKGATVDEVRTPVGLRSIHFDPAAGFKLNGEALKIKGVCVHHDAGCLGAAVPGDVWVRRLRYLKEMGCNAIRMSHNPPAPVLLDLCDQMGFMVMDEAFDEWEGVKNKWSTGHNVYPPKHFGYYEDFPDWGITDIQEMVQRDRNHPSIIMWSIGNEVDYPNDPYCHPSFQTMTGNNDANKPAEERVYDPNKPNAERLTVIAGRLVQAVKACDKTRPVTAALAYPELANLIGYSDVLDVVGYNYRESLYEKDRSAYPDRVLYGSENSPGLPEWLAVRDNPDICAQFIWTGIDYLGEAHGWPIRASQAGFMDLAGFPKPSYYYRQSLWSDTPMAYLAVRRANEPGISDTGGRSGGGPSWNWEPGERLIVDGYTNLAAAELYLNGKLLGGGRPDESGELLLSWEVTFEPGTLLLTGTDERGRTVKRELHTAAAAEQLKLTADTLQLWANLRDIVHVELEIVDSAGTSVYGAEVPVTVTVEGAGELLGLENGNVQDLEPYRSHTRNTHHGKLLAYIRAGAVSGTIKVTAVAPGLPRAELEISTYIQP
ncbi:glycoside hydrolase family 2 TIM barrel-domain containing protein [Paenibacillus sp. FSL K6-1096]|uniref:glycoside hydrolase family 2 TIM barrel-domain containing protein n=1 Tax=Paenibacillus sp. FSL K6-1096 TaxID=2921460 RepID=UPI0030EDC318